MLIIINIIITTNDLVHLGHLDPVLGWICESWCIPMHFLSTVTALNNIMLLSVVKQLQQHSPQANTEIHIV